MEGSLCLYIIIQAQVMKTSKSPIVTFHSTPATTFKFSANTGILLYSTQTHTVLRNNTTKSIYWNDKILCKKIAYNS